MKITFSNFPVYALICSLFLSGFIPQYLALFIFIVFFILNPKLHFKKNIFLVIPILFFLVALISYLFNLLITKQTDAYTLIFWTVSYSPPFILCWLMIGNQKNIDFFALYKFYKKLVYLQTFLLIISAIQFRTYVVGDPAKGTIGDANWVAFHLCVVLIYEVTRLVSNIKTRQATRKQIRNSFLEILYFFIVLIIPESTANLGLVMLIVGLLFFNEFILSRINLKRIIIVLIIVIPSFYLVSQNFVFLRISSAFHDLSEASIDANPYFTKLSTYEKVLSGEIFKNCSWLVGSGPSTFTSRSSVIRMPEERVNDFPFELPYFKSKLFDQYISSIYAAWRITGESWGNFASPQTTVISVTVELGVLGLLVFASFFYFIQRRTGFIRFTPANAHLKKFIRYFSLFFILSLFHLNFWEYPIVSFTYIIFAFSILNISHHPEQLSAIEN